MRIFGAIAALFLLLPGLCALAFTPALFDQGSGPDNYLDEVVWVFWIPGFIAGAVGVWALFAASGKARRAGKLSNGAMVGYAFLGLIGAGLAVPGLYSAFSLLMYAVVLPLRDAGDADMAAYFGEVLGGSVIWVIIGVAGGAMIYWAARKLAEGEGPQVSGESGKDGES